MTMFSIGSVQRQHYPDELDMRLMAVVRTRSKLSWVVLMCVAASLASCGPVGDVSSRTSTGATAEYSVRARWEHPALLSGEADTVKHEFIVTNPTKETVRITRVDKSCACAAADLGSRTLRAGESTVLSVRVNVRDRSQPFRPICVVHTDTGRSWNYGFEVPIYPKHEFLPKIIDAGKAKAGARLTAEVQLVVHARKRSADPVQLTVHQPFSEADPDALVVHSVLNDVVSEAVQDDIYRHTYNYAVEWQVVEVDSPRRQSFLLRPAGDAVGGVVDEYVRVAWDVDGPYQTDVPRVFFPSRRVADTRDTVDVTVSRKDGTEFRMGSVSISCPGVTSACVTADQMLVEHVVTYTLERDASAESLYGETVIAVVDADGNDRVRLPIISIP